MVFFFLPSLRKPTTVSKSLGKIFQLVFKVPILICFKNMVFKRCSHEPIIKFNFSHEKLKYFDLLAMPMS
jgi:hypothetical protein